MSRQLSEAATVAALGQVTIPNPAFAHRNHTTEGMRLAPHWTGRILSRMPSLEPEAALALLAYERLDGSGHSQGLNATSLGREARLVQALRAAVEAPAAFAGGRWHPAHADAALRARVADGTLDLAGVDCVLAALGQRRTIRYDIGFDLTLRESDVLRELATGLPNKEIARTLGLSPKTVSSHLERIFQKLGVRTRAAATLRALESGLF